MFIIVVILLFMAGVFNAECDTIAYHPDKVWFKKLWWTRSNWRRDLFIDAWTIRNPFLLKIVESRVGWLFLKSIGNFMLDGWHFCKTVQLNCFYISFLILISIVYPLDMSHLIAMYIILSGSHAIGFLINFDVI